MPRIKDKYSENKSQTQLYLGFTLRSLFWKIKIKLIFGKLDKSANYEISSTYILDLRRL